MLKIALKEKDQVRSVLVPESKTIRQVLIENHVDYCDRTVYVNALPIQPSGFDIPFSHISDEASRYIISLSPYAPADQNTSRSEKAERNLFHTAHAPKVYLISSVCIIVSALTAQEIQDLKRYRPEVLQIRDENRESLFAIDIESGYGSLKNFGAVYSDRVTCEGKATITILLNSAEHDLADIVCNRLGVSFHKLVQLEKRILKELHGIPIDKDEADYCFTQI